MLLKTMSMFGMVMTIPFFYCSDQVITMLFGSEWLFASEPLKILSIMLTLQAMNIALADGLTTRGLRCFRTLVQFITVILAVIFYYTFSLGNGVVGGAYAGLFIEALALVGFGYSSPGAGKWHKKLSFLTSSFFRRAVDGELPSSLLAFRRNNGSYSDFSFYPPLGQGPVSIRKKYLQRALLSGKRGGRGG